MEYTVEDRVVARTGIASLGWRMGEGYVKETITVKSAVWCVVYGKEVVAECRSHAKAKLIAKVLNGANNE